MKASGGFFITGSGGCFGAFAIAGTLTFRRRFCGLGCRLFTFVFIVCFVKTASLENNARTTAEKAGTGAAASLTLDFRRLGHAMKNILNLGAAFTLIGVGGHSNFLCNTVTE